MEQLENHSAAKSAEFAVVKAWIEARRQTRWFKSDAIGGLATGRRVWCGTPSRPPTSADRPRVDRRDVGKLLVALCLSNLAFGIGESTIRRSANESGTLPSSGRELRLRVGLRSRTRSLA